MQRILTAVGILFGIANSYTEVWTDCSREFEPVEIAAQTVTVPSPAEIDYKAGLGKEFREALAGRTDIDWKAVQDHYREWSEHTTTLSGPARMLVACVLSVVTQGMGTSQWLAGHGIAEGTATNAALSSGIQTLAASAGTALAANLGDLSKAFDELTSTAALKNLTASILSAGLQLDTAASLPEATLKSAESLAIQTGLQNRKLGDILISDVVDTGSAQLAHKIGDAKATGALNQVTHKAAHGTLAVTSAKLTGRDPVGAAVGAVVGEIAAESLYEDGKDPAKTAAQARIIGDTAAFVAGRDVASADSAGATALENNFLEHLPEIDAQRALAKMMLSEEDAVPLLEILDDAEQRAIEAAKDPIVNTVALSAVGMGIPFVAKTAAVVGTAATAHYYGSIAVDSGVAGLKQEAKDHPILTTMAVMPFVPGPKVLKVTKFSNTTNKAPYNARAMESLLQKNNPGATVTSSTLPPASGPNVRVAGNALEKEIELPSGNMKTVSVPFDNRGLPIFDKHAVVETRISGDLSSMSGEAHMRAATRQLREDIKAGRVDKNLFTEGQLEDIQKGKKTIEGFIWHHDGSVKGRMQLVPEEIHEKVKHQGGNSMWGGGKK